MHRPCVATTSHRRVDHALLLQIAREAGGEEKERILRDDRRVSVMCESSGARSWWCDGGGGGAVGAAGAVLMMRSKTRDEMADELLGLQRPWDWQIGYATLRLVAAAAAVATTDATTRTTTTTEVDRGHPVATTAAAAAIATTHHRVVAATMTVVMTATADEVGDPDRLTTAVTANPVLEATLLRSTSATWPTTPGGPISRTL